MKKFIKSAIVCVAAAAMLTTVAPVNTYAATKWVTVKTQKELEAAIKKGTKNIKIATSKKVTFTIPNDAKLAAKLAKISFNVDATKATIKNNAKVKAITVTNADKFTENAKGNSIKVTDSDLKLTVTAKAEVKTITVAKTYAEVTVVADGKVANVDVAKKAAVALKGKSDDAIAVTAKAEGAKITAKVPVAVTAEKKVEIKIKEGADDSTVIAKADVKLNVEEKASVKSVEVQAAGADVTVAAKGTVAEVKVAESAEGAKLNIAGSTSESVKVTVAAKDTSIKAETAIAVETASKDLNVAIDNKTDAKIEVTDPEGNKSTVDAGKTEETKPADKPSTGGSTGGTTGGSGSSVVTYTKPELVSATAIKFVSGGAVKATLTPGSSLTVKGYDFAKVWSFIQEAQKAINNDSDSDGLASVTLENVKIAIDYKNKDSIVITSEKPEHKATITVDKDGVYTATLNK